MTSSTTQTWIRTFKGHKVDLALPTNDVIDLEDIAHALSLLCRFNGHVPQLYSVGQHSILVSRQIRLKGHNAMAQLLGLMHDAPEAYLGDMTTPEKNLPGMRKIYDKYHDYFQQVIANTFYLKWTGQRAEQVHLADKMVCAAEMRAMMPSEDWRDLEHPPVEGEILPWYPEVTKKLFISIFHSLKEKLSREGLDARREGLDA